MAMLNKRRLMKHAGNDDGLEEENERKSTHDHQYVKKITRNDFTIWQLLTPFCYANEHFFHLFFFLSIFGFDRFVWISWLTKIKITQQTQNSNWIISVLESYSNSKYNALKLVGIANVCMFSFALFKYFVLSFISFFIDALIFPSSEIYAR